MTQRGQITSQSLSWLAYFSQKGHFSQEPGSISRMLMSLKRATMSVRGLKLVTLLRVNVWQVIPTSLRNSTIPNLRRVIGLQATTISWTHVQQNLVGLQRTGPWKRLPGPALLLRDKCLLHRVERLNALL